MLTADLVDARKKDGALVLRPFDPQTRIEAHGIAEAMVEEARAHVGRPRAELEETLSSIAENAAKPKVMLGLKKLLLDDCDFEPSTKAPPAELRRALFTRASEVRRTGTFDRVAVIAEVAATLGLEPAELEHSLFSDLKGEHVLMRAPTVAAPSLVDAWELGQAQAVLLTAVRVVCEVRAVSPGLLRALFTKLKFHRLLFTATPIEGERDAYAIAIDGPFSMFDAVTKYGVRLALALPAIRALEHWSLMADIRWGKAREALTFQLASPTPAPLTVTTDAPSSSKSGKNGKSGKSGNNARTRRANGASGAPAAVAPVPAQRVDGASPPAELHVSDDVRDLLEGIGRHKGWHARIAATILDVPGLGVCVPDLELRKGTNPTPVFVELLGFWSRDAVFHRIALVEGGLPAPHVPARTQAGGEAGETGGEAAKIVFCASARLRVSPELLDPADVPASLYVFKEKISVRALLERAEVLLCRGKSSTS